MRILLIAALALPFGDEAEILRPLQAKGVKVKKTPAGVVTGVDMGVLKGITIEDYRAIGQCRNLVTLHLLADEMAFTDEAAAQLTGLDRLEKFFSNGARLTDDGFKSLASWKSLKQIGFDHWFRTKKDQPIGAGLAHLAALPNLESVRLGGCQVGIEAMEALATIKTLKKIDVSHARWVDDDSLVLLQRLPDLRIFIGSPQYSPRLTDAALRNLSGVKSLEEIELSEI